MSGIYFDGEAMSMIVNLLDNGPDKMEALEGYIKEADESENTLSRSGTSPHTPSARYTYRPEPDRTHPRPVLWPKRIRPDIPDKWLRGQAPPSLYQRRKYAMWNNPPLPHWPPRCEYAFLRSPGICPPPSPDWPSKAGANSAGSR